MLIDTLNDHVESNMEYVFKSIKKYILTIRYNYGVFILSHKKTSFK
jgi:hypothetical protein